MPKVEPTPYVDENGNLVIPPDLLHTHHSAGNRPGALNCELIALISGVRLRIAIKDGKVLAVTRLEQEPDNCADLVYHSNASFDFWDNPEDDAAWNDVETT